MRTDNKGKKKQPPWPPHCEGEEKKDGSLSKGKEKRKRENLIGQKKGGCCALVLAAKKKKKNRPSDNISRKEKKTEKRTLFLKFGKKGKKEARSPYITRVQVRSPPLQVTEKGKEKWGDLSPVQWGEKKEAPARRPHYVRNWGEKESACL